jgi:hypothetical protein
MRAARARMENCIFGLEGLKFGSVWKVGREVEAVGLEDEMKLLLMRMGFG